MNEAMKNEMIVKLQAAGATYHKELRSWTYPGVRGYMSAEALYRFLMKQVDNETKTR